MIREMAEPKIEKLDLYQVMLLDNDPNDGVEIHESTNVDFLRISEHLASGGSVFITSKNSQKRLLRPLKRRTVPQRKASKTAKALCFQYTQKSSA